MATGNSNETIAPVEWEILGIPGKSDQTVSLESGECLFVVGANGSGKSALIQQFTSDIHNNGLHFERFAAHRQPWINVDTVLSGKTPEDKANSKESIKHRDAQSISRFSSLNDDTKHQNIFDDLIENYQVYDQQLKNIQNSGKTKKQKRVEIDELEETNPLTKLNALLKRGNIPIELNPDRRNNSQLTIHHNENDIDIGVREMSDGERFAFLFAATTVTMPPGTVLLIDEPEIHLHQSIVDPFLSALVASRKNCFFVFSTHNIALPAAHPESKVIVVRSCEWQADIPSLFDVELLTPETPIPEDVKQYILGVKGKVLFVEGAGTKALDDAQIYRKLFPEFTVISKGGYSDVDKTVMDLQKAKALHHIDAYGLIDKDQREPDDVLEKLKKNINVLKLWSVESLYFSYEAIEAVAKYQIETKAIDRTRMHTSTTRLLLNACRNLSHSQIAAQIAEYLAKNKIRMDVEREIKAKDITSVQRKTRIPNKLESVEDFPTIRISVENPFSLLISRFKQDIKVAIDITSQRTPELKEVWAMWTHLLSEYPIHKTNAFDTITKELKLDFQSYANILISLLQEDEELAKKLRGYVDMHLPTIG